MLPPPSFFSNAIIIYRASSAATLLQPFLGGRSALIPSAAPPHQGLRRDVCSYGSGQSRVRARVRVLAVMRLTQSGFWGGTSLCIIWLNTINDGIM